MRRFAAISLAIILAFGLAACGTESEPPEGVFVCTHADSSNFEADEVWMEFAADGTGVLYMGFSVSNFTWERSTFGKIVVTEPEYDDTVSYLTWDGNKLKYDYGFDDYVLEKAPALDAPIGTYECVSAESDDFTAEQVWIEFAADGTCVLYMDRIPSDATWSLHGNRIVIVEPDYDDYRSVAVWDGTSLDLTYGYDRYVFDICPDASVPTGDYACTFVDVDDKYTADEVFLTLNEGGTGELIMYGVYSTIVWEQHGNRIVIVEPDFDDWLSIARWDGDKLTLNYTHSEYLEFVPEL